MFLQSVFLLVAVVVSVVSSHQTFHQGYFHGHLNGVQPTCEPIKVGLCQGVGYNETMMPNMVGHDAQSDADSLLQTFTPLIQYGCSSHLKLFLCSAYVPMCTDKVAQPIGPCRDLCQSVRSKCEPVLVEFGFAWPASLDCNLFHPENNHVHMCIPGSVHPPPLVAREPAGGGPETSRVIPTGTRPPLTFGDVVGREVMVPGKTASTDFRDGVCGRKILSRGQCWIHCGTEEGTSSSLFLESDKAFARKYVLLWAVLSAVGAFGAVLAATTFARRLSSPAERPIVYMGVSQVLYSVGVVIGVSGSSSSHCLHDKISSLQVLAKGSLVPPTCSLVFLLTYFFSIAAALWWVMLCLSWLLSVNKSFATSLEGREWSLFHLVTWGFASILTCTVLLNKSVDADELTGICGVGFQDSTLLLYFHLIPWCCCLGTGVLFLLTGLCVRLQRRGSNYEYVGRVANFTNMQHKRMTEKSRATWKRVLVFCLAHLFPATALLSTLAYELSFRMDWEVGLSRANPRVFLLRHTTQFVVGLTGSLWILWLYSSKSWLEVLRNLKQRLTCENFFTKGNKRNMSGMGRNTPLSGTLNPGCRSLPAIPEERMPMSCDLAARTETWRRGETIV